mgnify:CR=1 FL=1
MYKKRWICIKCGYDTNKKQNYEKHISRSSACEKRIKRLQIKDYSQDVNPSVNPVPQDVNPSVDSTPRDVNPSVDPTPQNVNLNNKNNFKCEFCDKELCSLWNLKRHIITCKKADSLQCPTCKKIFTSRQGKYKHMKSVKCELVLTEEQQRIKELEEELENEKQKRKEAEESKSTINNYNITNNNNNYFDHSINYNNYDNLNVDHITKDDIKRLFNNCRMQYPELSEDLTRMILGIKENQCIFLPEGQKSNTCAVIKDGVEMRKPLIRVLMDLGVQTATLIRDSNVIVRNKKDVVNNQFWADNRNACGLNISDIEYMTDNDKEIVQRNKNIVLDMCDGKI